MPVLFAISHELFLSITLYRRSKQMIIFIEAICQGTVLVTKQHGDQSRCILLKLDCADETVNEMNGCNGKLEHYILVSFYSTLITTVTHGGVY